MTSFRRSLLAALLLALLSVVPAQGASAAPALAVPAEDPVPSAAPEELDSSLTEATDALQTDLTEMRSQQQEAQEAYDAARAKADELRAIVARNEVKVEAARLIVAQYARTIYMNGPTDLSVLASMIDTEDPGDLMRRADEALRVGDHKDDQYDRAVALLKRHEEMKSAAETAETAAQASLDSIENQLMGLRRQLADGVGAWADHLAGQTSLFSAEQARLNSEAAQAWADYLGRLADWRVPSVDISDLTKRQLPAGLTVSRNNPGVARWSDDGHRAVVVPERVVAAVTYAVSKMGTTYKWHRSNETEMDCSALVDRAWHLPSVPREDRVDVRDLVPGGVSGIAKTTRLVPTAKLTIGDVVFLTDPGRGVHHAGMVLTPDLMIAADATTGAVNALEIPRNRVWHVGRLSLAPPSKDNALPRTTKKPFQCGADPAAFVSLPDGRVLSNPDLCPPSAVFGESHMQDAAIRVGRCAAAIWPALLTIGGWRPYDPYPDHPSGRAVDIMLPDGCSTDPANVALGNAIAEFFMKNSGKFEVQYIIWNQRIWNAETEGPLAPTEWRGMSNRGGCTANHQDHVHVSVIGPNVNPEPVAPEPAPAADDSQPTVDQTSADTEVLEPTTDPPLVYSAPQGRNGS